MTTKENRTIRTYENVKVKIEYDESLEKFRFFLHSKDLGIVLLSLSDRETLVNHNQSGTFFGYGYVDGDLTEELNLIEAIQTGVLLD